jgi:hypothetical protein
LDLRLSKVTKIGRERSERKISVTALSSMMMMAWLILIGSFAWE